MSAEDEMDTMGGPSSNGGSMMPNDNGTPGSSRASMKKLGASAWNVGAFSLIAVLLWVNSRPECY